MMSRASYVFACYSVVAERKVDLEESEGEERRTTCECENRSGAGRGGGGGGVGKCVER